MQGKTLAGFLSATRNFTHKVESKPGYWVGDPRFIVFEFTSTFVLRDQQCRIMNRYMREVAKGNSLVHQMIMGAGKTTVIGPLLALLLADGKQLVAQVVPNQLLEMSRGVMRECFSAVISKAVYTFTFQRQDGCEARSPTCQPPRRVSTPFRV